MRASLILSALFLAGVASADNTTPAPSTPKPSEKKFLLDVEFGSAFVNRNDQGIPGDTGTRFDFNQLTGRGGFAYSRWALSYEGETGTGYRLLYAPFRINGVGQFSNSVNFQDATFAAGQDTQGTYQFNSYRATWRNRWKQGPNSDWRIGATFKIRDAEVALRQGNVFRTERDPRGIVPALLHIYGEEKIGRNWTFVFDFDGLAAPQGRAFDIGLRLGYQVTPDTRVLFGIRSLEGGADNPQVYSFAWVNYVSVGLQHRF